MKISNFNLGIGLPLTLPDVPTPFFESFLAMEKPDFTYLRPSRTGPIHMLRNSIVREAQLCGCSHLAMLDTDQMYPLNTITRLLSHRVKIVGARIRRRYPVFDNLLYRGKIGDYKPVDKAESRSGKLIEVDFTGTGCLLIEMDVFRRLHFPWFENVHDGDESTGEDYGFCLKARRAGIPIHVDTGLYVTHLTRFGITDEFADIYEWAVKSIKEQERARQIAGTIS